MISRYLDLVSRHCSSLFDLCDRFYLDAPGVPQEARASAAQLAVRALGLKQLEHYKVGAKSELTPSGQPLMVRSKGSGEAMMIADAAWCLVDPHERLLTVRTIFYDFLRQNQIGGLQERHERMMAILLSLTSPRVFDTRGHVMSFGVGLDASSCAINARLNRVDEALGWSFLQSWCQDLESAEFYMATPRRDVLADRPTAHWLRALRAARFTPHSAMLGHRDGQLHVAMEFERQGEALTAGVPDLPSSDSVMVRRFLDAVNAPQAEMFSDSERLRLELTLSQGDGEPVLELEAVAWSRACQPCARDYAWIVELERGLELDASRSISASLTPQDAQVMHMGIVMVHELDASATAGEPWRCESEIEWTASLPDLRKLKSGKLEEDVIDGAMQRAMDALLTHQSDEGQWPPLQSAPLGASCVLSTAFVAWSLARHGGPNMESALMAARRGAQWLDIMREHDAGWGLGPYSGADTLTTSLVLLLFEATQHHVRHEDREWLTHYWSKKQGGVCFSSGPLHWADVHPDQTALCWALFQPSERQQRYRSFHDYLAEFASESGVWPTYWWSSHWLTTYFHLMVFDDDDDLRGQFMIDEELFWDLVQDETGERASSFKGPDSFELAWACACAARLGYDDVAQTLGLRLLSRQQMDGSWHGEQVVRLTSPGCKSPWEDGEGRGELLKDTYGCLTTASALWALSELREIQQFRYDY